MIETKDRIDQVDRTLRTMMEKCPTTHPEIRLKVLIKSSVENDIAAKQKEFLVRYSSNIIQLWLSYNAQEDNFWHRITFPNIERICLELPFSFNKTFQGILLARPIPCEDSRQQSSYESLIMNHAKHLKTLFIKDLNNRKLDVIAPFPNLKRLMLTRVRAETAFALIYVCRFTLEYLEIEEWYNISSVHKALSKEDCKLIKLKSLYIKFDYLESHLPIICSNAVQLESLVFHGVKTTFQSIEWPQFTNLTNLYIGESDSQLLRILSRSVLKFVLNLLGKTTCLWDDIHLLKEVFLWNKNSSPIIFQFFI